MMQRGEWMFGSVFVLAGFCLVWAGGCVSLNTHRGLEAQNRSLIAEKTHLDQELYDARQVADSLRTRVGSLDRELGGKDDFIENLRTENDLLDEMMRKAQAELEAVAAGMKLSDITITGPKLPAPLDNALKRFADEHPAMVSYDAAAGTVKWQADLLFTLGSDVVKDSTKEALRRFCEIIKSPVAEDFEVLVVGHTDTRPIVKPQTKAKHPTNWHLSAHRAISVASVLRQNGYPKERIGVMGYGAYRPVADNATEDGAGKNRRVEIYLVPAGSIVRTTDVRPIAGEAPALARVMQP